MRGWIWMATAMLAVSMPMAAPAQTGGEWQGDPAVGGPERFRAALQEMRTQVLRPGEAVADWDRGGANPDAALRARGADSHYFLNRGDDGTSVGILSTRPIADFAPAGWRVVDSYGSSATHLESPQIDFVPMSARYVLATRSQFRRRGDVDCTPGITNALLYEIPGAPSRDGDDVMPAMFRMLILALEGQELCVRSDGDAARGYRSRTFLPDGRLLPELSDDNDLSTIVPAAPVERLIAPPPEHSDATPAT